MDFPCRLREYITNFFVRIKCFKFSFLCRKLIESDSQCQTLRDEIKKLKHEVEQLKVVNAQKAAGTATYT